MISTEQPLYERRQFGWTMVGAMFVAIAIVFVLGGIKTNGEVTTLGGLLFFILLLMSLFSSMTVRVTPKELVWWMGSMRGLGKTIPIAEIESAEAIRTHLWDGWGIHLTTHGWLWNVAGFNAVEIKLKSGTRYAIGTPEPKELTAAIKRARKKSR